MFFDLPLTDKLYFISALIMQIPEIINAFMDSSSKPNFYTSIIAIVVWSTFSIKAMRRARLAWIYMAVGFVNLIISCILLYLSINRNKITPITLNYNYDIPTQYIPKTTSISTSTMSIPQKLSMYNEVINKLPVGSHYYSPIDRNTNYPFIDQNKDHQKNNGKMYRVRY
jgi:hypothetical protein